MLSRKGVQLAVASATGPEPRPFAMTAVCRERRNNLYLSRKQDSVARSTTGSMTLETALAWNGGGMSSVPSNVGVFFGKSDKRSEGWY